MRRALRRFFDWKSPPNAKAAAEHAHDWMLAGQRGAPRGDDLAAARMETELDAHRQQRAHALQDDA
jgi:hypothetical protein